MVALGGWAFSYERGNPVFSRGGPTFLLSRGGPVSDDPLGVLVCDHAGLVINKFLSWRMFPSRADFPVTGSVPRTVLFPYFPQTGLFPRGGPTGVPRS